MRAISILLLSVAIFACAQDIRPAFEVASVKLNTSGSGHSDTDGDNAQVVMTNLTLHRLIERAYLINPPQISGPAWLESVRVDIAAKYPAGATEVQRQQMLRTLLEDRFKLAVHRETREMPGYVLVVAKSGFKLKPVEGEENDTDHGGGRIQTLSAKGTSMATLAGLVSRYLNAIVVDRTGLAGVYHFDLRWTRDDPNSERADDVPTLPIALQETLGLRLQAQKVPVEMVVVDHVERVPAEN